MTDFEIIRHVDDGANFYLQFFGDACHMEYHDNGLYSLIMPKKSEQGVRFAFNVRLENFPEKEQIEKIAEIKALNLPVWWDLQSSDKLYKLIYGKDKEKIIGEPAEGEELYMAILPDGQPKTESAADIAIKKVDNPEAFEEWVNFVNDVMNSGYTDIHPKNHYHLCKQGIINCFSCYKDNVLASVASILNNNNISSLEFVATHPAHRRKGLARAVCSQAIRDSFDNGSKLLRSGQ